MTQWDIQYAAALGTVTRAAGQVEDYAESGSRLDSTAQSLVGVLTNSGPVAQACGDLAMNILGPDAETLVGHSTSALLGTSAAIEAYAHGQVEMARTAQRNATEATYPDMPGGR